MKKILLIVSVFGMFFTGCRHQLYQVQQTSETRVFITDALPQDVQMTAMIEPYRDEMEDLLNKELAYVPIALDQEGFISTLGNFVTDLMKLEGDKIWSERHNGQKIDLVLMNRGGLRRTFAPGILTVRSMYELMPFENEAVVVTMTGEKFYDLVTFLRASERGHPVSGIVFNKNSDDRDFEINGQKFDPQRNYAVLTNDYLQKGGDQMRFFLDPVDVEFLNIKLRDMFIQHLEKTDTIHVNMNPRYLE